MQRETAVDRTDAGRVRSWDMGLQAVRTLESMLDRCQFDCIACLGMLWIVQADACLCTAKLVRETAYSAVVLHTCQAADMHFLEKHL